MTTVNNSSFNDKIPFLDGIKYNAKEIDFFNSVFSTTIGENDIIEASDFSNYKSGSNAFIDNLIKTGEKWTLDIVNKVLDSIRVNDKAQTSVISNEKSTATVDANFDPEIKEAFDLLINCRNNNLEMINETEQKIRQLREQLRPYLSKIKDPQISEEEKAQILKEIEPTKNEMLKLNNMLKILKKGQNITFEDLKSAGILDSTDISKEQYKKLLTSFKINNNDIESIDCSLTFKDINGNPKDINLKVSIAFISNYIYKKCEPGTTYSQALEKILQEFSSMVDKLPNDVKNDLYNEVSGINLARRNQAEYGHAGIYSTENNDITLYMERLLDRDLDIKDSLGTFMHEIGHAVETKGEESTSPEFKTKFEELRSLLIKKGLVPADYSNKTEGYYPLVSADEFFAEVVYSVRKGKFSEFGGLASALRTSDPEVQAKLDELYAEGDAIIKNRHNDDRSDKMGLHSGDLLRQIREDETVSDAYDRMTFPLDQDLYSKYGNNISNMFKAYYEYKKNPNDGAEGINLMCTLEANYPEDFEMISKIFDKKLSENGLI